MNTKSFIVSVAVTFAVVISTSGCSNFDELNKDPDKPSTATAGWFATDMLTSISSRTFSRTVVFQEPYNLSKYVLWTQTQPPLQYNDLRRANFSKFTVLRNVEEMVSYATSPGQENSYRALGHFVRAWQFFQLTMRVGDIPCSEAIQGDTGIIKPRYDTQKDVFRNIISELDTAYELFRTGEAFSGDFLYGGDPAKWAKLTNCFQLYVLMNLCYKTSDNDLGVIQKFNEVAGRPLMESFHDNFCVTYNGTKGYTYPWSNTPVEVNEYFEVTMLSTTFIDQFVANRDRRLFYVAEPSERLLAEGKAPSSFDAYEGVEPSDEYASTLGSKTSGAYSNLNRRYLENATAEPVGMLCYWDVQFLLAEAAVRGWISGPADTYYANGIKSSMRFYAHWADEAYGHGVLLDDDYIENYPASIALTGTDENKIRQIICQKYLAGFFHNEYQAWFEFRRTGYPEFVLNPETNSNPTDNTKFPTRWLYPQNEIDFNTENLEAAVQRQYGGSDDHNGIMWILQR